MLMNVKSFMQGRAIMWTASCQYGGVAYCVTDDTPGKAATKLNDLVVPDDPAPVMRSISDVLKDGTVHRSGRRIAEDNYTAMVKIIKASMRQDPPDCGGFTTSLKPSTEAVAAITAMRKDISDLKQQVLALSVRVTQDAPSR